MQSVLITGGAGFIGQNLVHAWRAARPADRLVVVDAMTYAANVRSLEPLIADRSIQFVKGDIGDAALMQRLFEEHKFTRVAHLAAESHVDRSISDPEAFLQTNVLGTFTLLKAALDCWRASGDARQRALPPCLDRRGLWLARRDRSRLHRILALPPEFALRGEQGGKRPSGPRLRRDLWHAGADHELLQQLRPLSAPGKTDSADDHPCAGGQAAAGLRRRLQCPRLAARIRSLRRVDERDRARPHRRNLQCRRRQRAQQPRRGGPDLRHDRRRLRRRRAPRLALSVLSGRLRPAPAAHS